MAIRVLVADDSGSVRDVIRAVLERAGIEVCSDVADGLEVLKEAERCKPDLVLIDLAMPKMNGAEVALILKKRMPRSKIVLFTMYSEHVGKSLIEAIGVDAVLSKPNGMTQIVECIKSLVVA